MNGPLVIASRFIRLCSCQLNIITDYMNEVCVTCACKIGGNSGRTIINPRRACAERVTVVVRVCVCVCACVRACVRACVCLSVCMSVRTRYSGSTRN